MGDTSLLRINKEIKIKKKEREITEENDKNQKKKNIV